MTIRTNIVVPCFNEELRLPAARFVEFLRANPDVSMLFVNDGSGDNTAAVLEELAAQAPGQAAVLNLPANLGKGEAVRAGMGQLLSEQPQVGAAGGKALLGYWDADLAIPLADILRFRDILRAEPDAGIVLAARLPELGTRLRDSRRRRLFRRLFAALVRAGFGLRVRDTQCGAKLMRASLAGEVFAAPFSTKWLFDVEILARLAARHGSQAAATLIREEPLAECLNPENSRLTGAYILRVPLDLLRIFWRYRCR